MPGPYEEDRARGRFYGVGPREYQRSDERIREDVYDALTEHPDLDASDLHVQVASAEVTLSGTVPGREQKRMAEDAVDVVLGVREVRNEIRVARRGRELRDEPQSRAYPRGPAGEVGPSYTPETESSTREHESSPQTVYSSREPRESRPAGTPSQSTSPYAPGAPTTPYVPSAGSGEGSKLTAEYNPAPRSEYEPTDASAAHIIEGFEVHSADGQRLGRVKEVHEHDFLLDRPRKRDLYVPRSAIREVEGSSITLRQRADEIDHMSWDRSELLSSSHRREH
jgi:hypothetical protein